MAGKITTGLGQVMLATKSRGVMQLSLLIRLTKLYA